MPSDVAVIGSGVIGRACAWQLQRAGHSVTVFDPHPGSGATYVAAGMLAPVTEAAYGEEAIVALALQAADSWPEFATSLTEESGLDCGYRRDGTLLIAADASDRAHLQELQAFHAKLGLESDLVGPTRAREIEPLLAPSQRGGIFAAGDAQVDNRRLLAALFAAGARHGVEERRETVRRVLTAEGHVIGVETDVGVHHASLVLLAAGYQSIDVAGRANPYAPPTRPVKGQILRFHARPSAPELAVTVRALVAGASIYIVPRGDGRVVIGATMEDLGPDDTVTAGGVYQLLRDALRVLPTIAEYELLEARAGLRPGSPDNAAIVGESGLSGLLVATGHHRNGILFAPTTAEAIVGLVDTGSLPAFAAPLAPSRFVNR